MLKKNKRAACLCLADLAVMDEDESASQEDHDDDCGGSETNDDEAEVDAVGGQDDEPSQQHHHHSWGHFIEDNHHDHRDAGRHLLSSPGRIRLFHSHPSGREKRRTFER